MFEISVTTHFSAAHRLIDYKGACADLHGHNWEIAVYLRGSDLDRLGILVDFRKVKKCVKRIVDQLDHADLNTLPAFAKANPTSENIARHLYEQLSKALNCTSYAVARVTVAETPGNKVTYWEDKEGTRP